LHRGGHITSVLCDGLLHRNADREVIGVAVIARPIGTYLGRPTEARPDPTLVRLQDLFAAFSSLSAATVGLLSIVGLTFNIAVLKSTLPGHPVVKMNAAVC